ncbi:hypothetical protein ACRAWF_44735 [Streptomyces sp. L7]
MFGVRTSCTTVFSQDIENRSVTRNVASSTRLPRSAVGANSKYIRCL